MVILTAALENKYNPKLSKPEEFRRGLEFGI